MTLKRALDMTVSAASLLVLSPAIAAISALCALEFKALPFYPADRIGKDGKAFKMFKFRTMRDTRDENGELLPDDRRQTPLGTFLRKSGLDEMPQLFNVLKGDMSLVGPRPHGPEETIPDSHKQVFSVRPGLTGAWQVAAIGRKTRMSPMERLDLELDYATKEPSITRDAELVLRTFPAFFKGHDGETFR